MTSETAAISRKGPAPVFVVVMGVSGSGKTTVAEGVAAAIGGTFLEGDDFHPPGNKAKMGAGIPLEDEDRWPWFDRLAAAAKARLSEGKSPVLACSALKRRHRERLLRDIPEHRLVHLRGGYGLIKDRMDARQHEYMTSDLLQSQFDALEEPEPGPATLVLSIEDQPDEIVRKAVAWLGTA